MNDLPQIFVSILEQLHRLAVGPDDLPIDLIGSTTANGKRLKDIEKEHILRVLKEAGGQRGKAAEILGVDPKTLYRKLLEYEENGS